MNFLTCLNLSQIESRIKDLSGFKEVLLLAFGNKESIQSLRLGEFHMESVGVRIAMMQEAGNK